MNGQAGGSRRSLKRFRLLHPHDAAGDEVLLARSSVDEARAGQRPSILLVADEWFSRQGGISTFNRELAIALAQADCDVRVVVPKIDRDERREAAQAGVALVAPEPIPGIGGVGLLTMPPDLGGECYRPAVIVGHGRILGPYAFAQQKIFPDAKRLHIVHTDAERLESVKEQPPGRLATATAHERLQVEVDLAISAELVGAVGPLLTETITDAMRGFPAEGPSVVNIRPGLRDWGGTVDPANPPRRRQVLLIARAEEVRSKGIDIAVRAVAHAGDRFEPGSLDRPTLVVRGVPEPEADALGKRLEALVEGRAIVQPRAYSEDPDSLRRDLWQARVVVMPSRHEGFGLAAFEAIAAGVPVLVSRESGLGRMLREELTDAERREPREVVPVSHHEAEATTVWGDAIYAALVDPSAAFARAAEVRRQIQARGNWRPAVDLLLSKLDLSRPSARVEVPA